MSEEHIRQGIAAAEVVTLQPEQGFHTQLPADAVTSSPEPEENPLQAVTVAELMALQLPERKMVTPWLREGGTVMVFGPRGVGKTYFILGLAISIANGEGFLRWEGCAPKGVLLIDGEMALTELRGRVSNLLPGKPVASLRIVSHELVYEKVERDLNFGIKEWQGYLSRLLDDHPDPGRHLRQPFLPASHCSRGPARRLGK